MADLATLPVYGCSIYVSLDFFGFFWGLWLQCSRKAKCKQCAWWPIESLLVRSSKLSSKQASKQALSKTSVSLCKSHSYLKLFNNAGILWCRVQVALERLCRQQCSIAVSTVFPVPLAAAAADEGGANSRKANCKQCAWCPTESLLASS